MPFLPANVIRVMSFAEAHRRRDAGPPEGEDEFSLLMMALRNAAHTDKIQKHIIEVLGAKSLTRMLAELDDDAHEG
jgi:hypothetical protein